MKEQFQFPQFITVLEKPVIKEIIAQGANVYFVGGCVRDAIMSNLSGTNIPSKDIDIVVQKMKMDNLKTLLNKFGQCELVGESFAVLKYKEENGFELDIALPRRDSRAANYEDFVNAHSAIDVQSDPFMAIEGDLFRRDFTMNSIAISHEMEVIDPYGGVQDIKDKLVRATNLEAFVDDPLRIMRLVRFSLSTGFLPEQITYELVQKHSTSLSRITKSRKLEELQRMIINHNKKPEWGFLPKAATMFASMGLVEEVFGFMPETLLENLAPKITRLSEFLLCFRHSDPNFEYSKHYKTHLDIGKRRDIQTDDFREMRGLEILLRGLEKVASQMRETKNDQVSKAEMRKVFFQAMKIWPEGAVSSNVYKIFLKDFIDNDLPLTRGNLVIDGNDLIELGFKGPEVGQVTDAILNAIFELKLPHNKGAIINFAKSYNKQLV